MTPSDLIHQWPSAGTLGRALGIPAPRIYRWAERQSIPACYWGALLDAAKAQGIPLTAEDLVEMHDMRTRAGADRARHTPLH